MKYTKDHIPMLKQYFSSVCYAYAFQIALLSCIAGRAIEDNKLEAFHKMGLVEVNSYSPNLEKVNEIMNKIKMEIELKRKENERKI